MPSCVFPSNQAMCYLLQLCMDTILLGVGINSVCWLVKLLLLLVHLVNPARATQFLTTLGVMVLIFHLRRALCSLGRGVSERRKKNSDTILSSSPSPHTHMYTSIMYTHAYTRIVSFLPGKSRWQIVLFKKKRRIQPSYGWGERLSPSLYPCSPLPHNTHSFHMALGNVRLVEDIQERG